MKMSIFTRITYKLLRNTVKKQQTFCTNPINLTQEKDFPKKIFSGIQPTGAVHLGNYLGAITQWVRLQDTQKDVMYSIVDLHSITLPHKPKELAKNILEMAATLIACGIDPKKSVLFQQSHVPQHTELCWYLGCISTMARLTHLPQFKEKSAALKDVPLGLFIYPVLQAADILLYKATHIPVGDDQLQHLQLCQELVRMFNNRFGRCFPMPHAIVLEQGVSRVRSLRDPSKKMSKSDLDVKSRICLTDSNDDIVKKIRKAVTDTNSKITFNLDERPGVSNLISIHSILSGKSPSEICEEAKDFDTLKYKTLVADVVIEHVAPIRQKINELFLAPEHLFNILREGADAAANIAERTAEEVRYKLGLSQRVAIKQKLKNVVN